MTFLQDDDSKQTRDPAPIAKSFNEHFIELAQRLASKNTSDFDPSSVTAFVEKHKSSETKLLFPEITVQQTRQLIEVIPPGKATEADSLSACLLKIAAATVLRLK